MNAREWLRANSYDSVADLIDEVIKEWRETGNGTRRNWWDILAGGKDGKPRTIAERQFPVLRAAQLRQGKNVTDNAICYNPDEDIPQLVISGRWKEKIG